MITSKITAELFLNDGTKIVLDKTKMKSIQSLSQSTADASTIYYGCLPSTGSLEIIDTNGTIKGYIEDGLIDTSSLEINIYINDKIIRHHISTGSEYIEEDNSFQISFGDILDLWDEINFTGYYYPEHSETAYEMFSNIFISFGYSQTEIDEMLSNTVINGNLEEISIKDYLNSINIEYPYLPSSTFREMVDKFCTLAQLNCFLDINGMPKFINARPISSVYNNPIIIPQKSMYGSFSKSVLLKNKYDAVEVDEYIISKNKEIKTNVYSESISQLYNSEENDDFEYHKANDNFAGTVYYQFGAYAYISAKYNYISSITIPKFSNYNLNKTIKVYTGIDSENESNIKYSLQYNIKTSPSATVTISMNNDTEFNVIQTSDNILNETTGSGDIESLTATENYEWSTTAYSGTLTAIAELEDKSNLSNIKYINDENGNFIFNNVICISGRTIKTLNGYNRKTDNLPEFPDTITLYGDIEIIDAFNVNIEFYGDVEEILFEKSTANSENINEARNPISITTNELVSDKTTINGVEIVDIIKENILSDYSNGISNGSIDIAYTDYYYEDGSLAISANNGDIFSIGSIVKIENDNKLWKVTGVNFEKQGYPHYSELQVIEVKGDETKLKLELDLYKSNVTITRIYSENPSAITGTITEENEIYLNDVLKFNITADEYLVDSSIQSIKINGNNYINNSEYVVKGNIELTAISYSWEEIVNINEGSYMRFPLESSSGEENWEHSSNFIPFIIADRDIRISGTSQFTTNSGYNIDVIPQFTDIGNLDWGDQHSLINVTSDDGLVLGSISFSIKKPTKDGEFLYDNHSTLGDNAYMSTLLISKIEQYK